MSVGKLEGHLMPGEVSVVVSGAIVAHFHFVRIIFEYLLEEAVEVWRINADRNGV